MKYLRLALALAPVFLLCVLVGTAWAVIGEGTLNVVGANSTPTHFDIPLGVATDATICGVTTAEVGDPLPATLTVWVKSSDFGNEMLTANRIDDTDCYAFSYTPPDYGCNTTIVAYQALGLDSNNDMADDGVMNDSGASASGFRFVDEFGEPIGCAVPNGENSWGMVKSNYR